MITYLPNVMYPDKPFLIELPGLPKTRVTPDGLHKLVFAALGAYNIALNAKIDNIEQRLPKPRTPRRRRPTYITASNVCKFCELWVGSSWDMLKHSPVCKYYPKIKPAKENSK